MFKNLEKLLENTIERIINEKVYVFDEWWKQNFLDKDYSISSKEDLDKLSMEELKDIQLKWVDWISRHFTILVCMEMGVKFESKIDENLSETNRSFIEAIREVVKDKLYKKLVSLSSFEVKLHNIVKYSSFTSIEDYVSYATGDAKAQEELKEIIKEASELLVDCFTGWFVENCLTNNLLKWINENYKYGENRVCIYYVNNKEDGYLILYANILTNDGVYLNMPNSEHILFDVFKETNKEIHQNVVGSMDDFYYDLAAVRHNNIMEGFCGVPNNLYEEFADDLENIEDVVPFILNRLK